MHAPPTSFQTQNVKKDEISSISEQNLLPWAFIHSKAEGFCNKGEQIGGGTGVADGFYLLNVAEWLKAAACCSQLRVFKNRSLHPCLDSSLPREEERLMLPAQNKTCPATAPDLKVSSVSQRLLKHRNSAEGSLCLCVCRPLWMA